MESSGVEMLACPPSSAKMAVTVPSWGAGTTISRRASVCARSCSTAAMLRSITAISARLQRQVVQLALQRRPVTPQRDALALKGSEARLLLELLSLHQL